MAKKTNDRIVYHGEIIDISAALQYEFKIGTKFHFKNVSYDDIFTVIGTKTEPGTEYRQIRGTIQGEVWILLTTLQKETQMGTIAFPDKNGNYVFENEDEAKDTKSKKSNKKKGT